ncbi:MAG: hypothetical protein ACRDNX_02200 [Gaiellaceae bacterium]
MTGTLIAAVGLVLLAVPTASSTDQLKGPGVIRITNREVRFVKVDVGARGRSPGDMEIVRQLLYNRRITQKSLGHSELLCTYTTLNSRHCSGTYFLPRGRIVVGGAILYRQFHELAVLGGTGLYNNAKGSLTVTSLGRNPRRDILIFRLVV